MCIFWDLTTLPMLIDLSPCTLIVALKQFKYAIHIFKKIFLFYHCLFVTFNMDNNVGLNYIHTHSYNNLFISFIYTHTYIHTIIYHTHIHTLQHTAQMTRLLEFKEEG